MSNERENENLPPIEDSPNIRRFRVPITMRERIEIAKGAIGNIVRRLLGRLRSKK